MYFMSQCKNITHESLQYVTLNDVLTLISGFHRALLQSVTFISRLMHSVIQNINVKIYVV